MTIREGESLRVDPADDAMLFVCTHTSLLLSSWLKRWLSLP